MPEFEKWELLQSNSCQLHSARHLPDGLQLLKLFTATALGPVTTRQTGIKS